MRAIHPTKLAKGAVRISCLSLLLLLLTMILGSHGVYAQSLNIASGGENGGPVEIFADDGIEWQQGESVFIARGNAKAVRETLEVASDVLRAYYRDNNGTTEIWRLDVEGSVEIRSPTETAYGDLAIYDVINGVLVIRGENVRFVAGPDIITARDQIEYWEIKQIAVARGNAVAIRGDKTLKAEVLVAHFRRGGDGPTDIHRVDAYDNVIIESINETATADRGVYQVGTGMTTLTGSVKIIRGQNTLTGCKAEVNLNTGISNVYACEGQTGDRVQGVLLPEKNTVE